MTAESWNKVADQVNFNLGIDWDKFSEIVDLKAKVLDFGCGYGRISDQLNQLGYSGVVGIDPSSAMIERGRRMFPELDLLHSAGKLPFDDQSFDAIIVCAVFTSIPSSNDRQAAAREISRVLKPGGLLHFSEFCASEERTFVSALGAAMRYSTPEMLQHLFEGFECMQNEVIDATTMSGKQELSCHAFFTKPVNKARHGDR